MPGKTLPASSPPLLPRRRRGGRPAAARARRLSCRCRAAGILLVPFCLALPAGGASSAGVFAENLSWGAVEILLRAEPGEVRLDRDLVVTLAVITPSGVEAELPDLRDRFKGFTVAEGFVREPEPLADGRRRQEHRWRLTPGLEGEYRLAPFAVRVRDRTVVPPRESSFATRAVRFPAAGLDIEADGDVEVAPEPLRVPPTRREIGGWIAAGALAAAVLLGLAFLAGRLRRRRRLHLLSPRERALRELEQLLRRRLPEKGLYKDFYIELTMIVRRYIERAHGIRAPEQTTEEFLQAAACHPRFTPEVLARLRDFLHAADLVKFAGRQGTPRMAEEAVRTARGYVEEDAAADGLRQAETA